MRKSFFDFGFFIDGALMKAPTESGLPPAQHDALMRRFFPNEVPASASPSETPATPAPVESRLSPAQQSRLDQQAHFMAGTPGATPPSPLPANPTGGGNQGRFSGPYGTHVGPGISSEPPTDLRAPGAEENLGTGEIAEDHPALRQWYHHQNAARSLSALRNHRIQLIAAGKLTDGTDYHNIGQAEHARIKAVLAAYDQWKKTGGPKPDLSHLDEIRIHKNGKPWDHKAVIDGMYEDSKVDAAPSAAELFQGRIQLDRKIRRADDADGIRTEGLNPSDLYDGHTSSDLLSENHLIRGIGTANHFLALGSQHRRMSRLDPRTASIAIGRHLRAMADLEMHPAVTAQAEAYRGVHDRGVR
jgi:hypothetical protein